MTTKKKATPKSRNREVKESNSILYLRKENKRLNKAYLAERDAKRSIANQLLNVREVLQDALGEDKKKIEWDDVALAKRLVAQRDALAEQVSKLKDDLENAHGTIEELEREVEDARSGNTYA